MPPFLVFTTAMRPLIELFNMMANGVLRLLRVEPRDELEASFTSGELADLIAESGREGLLDDDESRRLARTLSSVEATVADVLVPRAELVALPVDPTVGDVAALSPTPASRGSRCRAADGPRRIPARQGHPRPHRRPGCRRAGRADPRPAGGAGRRPARRGAGRAAPASAHLGRAVDGGGRTVGLVAMEDLIEHYVGTVRDATNTRRVRRRIA